MLKLKTKYATELVINREGIGMYIYHISKGHLMCTQYTSVHYCTLLS